MTSHEENITDIADHVLRIYFKLTKQKLPAKTDKKKTYHWRYVTKFAKYIINNNISLGLVDQLIYYIVQNSRKMKHRPKLSMLVHENTIDNAYKNILEEYDKEERELKLLQNQYKFVKKSNFDIDIVQCFNQRRIGLTYLACSESCRKALNELDEIDRSMLPDFKDIAFKRIMCYSNTKLWHRIKSIMVDDFIKLNNDN